MTLFWLTHHTNKLYCKRYIRYTYALQRYFILISYIDVDMHTVFVYRYRYITTWQDKELALLGTCFAAMLVEATNSKESKQTEAESEDWTCGRNRG